MKIQVARMLATCWLALAANSAHACCLWPFCGWGMGYGPAYPMAAPGWGTYSASYAPWYPNPVMPAWNACCPTTCCDPCNNCSTSACGTPTQNTSGTSGSRKPQTDPAFQERRSTPANDDVPPSSRTLPPVENLSQPADTTPTDTFTPPPRRQPAAPADSFSAPADNATPAPFDANESISNKPPVTDPAETNSPNPTNDPNPPADSFGAPDPDNSQPPANGPQTRRSPTSQSSQLAEVTAPKRLAPSLRALPASHSPSSNKTPTVNSRDRLRWISNPAPDTHVRL
ncbi:MAG: hypothetical protein ACKO2P_16745 [Planctomycetota bacterium]